MGGKVWEGKSWSSASDTLSSRCPNRFSAGSVKEVVGDRCLEFRGEVQAEVKGFEGHWRTVSGVSENKTWSEGAE